MKCRVSSGEYTTTLDRTTVGEAAREAMELWRYKTIKPILKEVVTVEAEGKSFIFLTKALLE